MVDHLYLTRYCEHNTEYVEIVLSSDCNILEFSDLDVIIDALRATTNTKQVGALIKQFEQIKNTQCVALDHDEEYDRENNAPI